jgi:hypothetical protein
MLPVGMEEAAAKRMGAVITTLQTCHMVILQEPAKVAAVIEEAARKAKVKYERLSRHSTTQGEPDVSANHV